MQHPVAGLRLWLGFALAISAASARAEQTPPFQLRAEGSFPVQYNQTATASSRQDVWSAAPYLGAIATVGLQSDFTASLFANGGHPMLGSFRDTDNTFVSAGGNIVRHLGPWRVGISFEHTHFYDGIFGATTTIANDTNMFASYVWWARPDLRIRPTATATVRVDDMFAVQRYEVRGGVAIEQRLSGPWWFVLEPRLRTDAYVGGSSGRRDVRTSVTGGLKYEFNENVNALILAGYENRWSTVASKNADRFTAGASLNFGIDFERPRWPAGL